MTRRCHPDNARLSPTPVRSLQRRAHDAHVTRGIEGVVHAPFRFFYQDLSAAATIHGKVRLGLSMFTIGKYDLQMYIINSIIPPIEERHQTSVFSHTLFGFCDRNLDVTPKEALWSQF